MLAGYDIVDDPLGAQNATPTTDEDGEVCWYTEIEPYDDEPTRGACVDCGEEFGLRGSPEDAGDSAEEEPLDGDVNGRVGCGGMKDEAAPVQRRGRLLPNDAFRTEFVRNAYTVAIRRAARDAHRSVCDRDADECDVCRELAQGIAEAKRALNHPV